MRYPKRRDIARGLTGLWFIATVILGLGILSVAAQPSSTGLPLPRFASLAADEVNVRAGPGRRYPVNWRFVRKGLPVMIVAEFEVWRKIRDADGAEGWVHRSLLSGRRTALIVNGLTHLHAKPDSQAPVTVIAEPGVHGRLRECRPGWCEMEVESYTGWIRRQNIFGALDEEVFD